MTQEKPNLTEALEQLDLTSTIVLMGVLNQRALSLLLDKENKKSSLAIHKAPLAKPNKTLIIPT